MTMTLVNTVTVGAGGAASIDFTSIPQTGTDLLVVLSARGDNVNATRSLLVKLNSSSTSYSDKTLWGSGSSVGSSSSSSGGVDINGGVIPAAGSTASTFSNGSIYIPNYSGSTNKSVSIDNVQENNATAAQQYLTAGLWSNTSAITSINLTPSSGNFVQYSTASLYTITKGSGGATVS